MKVYVTKFVTPSSLDDARAWEVVDEMLAFGPAFSSLARAQRWAEKVSSADYRETTWRDNTDPDLNPEDQIEEFVRTNHAPDDLPALDWTETAPGYWRADRRYAKAFDPELDPPDEAVAIGEIEIDAAAVDG